MKRTLALILAALLALTTVALAQGDASAPFEETFTFSLIEPLSQQEEGNMIDRAIEEALNVKIERTLVPNSGYEDKLNVLLASAKLPDLVQMRGNVDNAWITQEAILPLNDLLDKYGQDYLKAWEGVEPYLYDDGKTIYSMKRRDAFTFGYSNCIRQDWLDKLGLEMPTTLDEYIEVLRAFKTKDPNGNGLADEIPYVAGTGALRTFAEAYGLLGNMYLQDGKVVTQYDSEHFFPYVQKMAELYAEGLIDMEFSARTDEVRAELMAADQGGSSFANGNAMTEITQALRANGKTDALLSVLLPIEGPGGRHIGGRNPGGKALCITVSAKEPEKLMHYMNFYWTEKGIELTNFGIEGVTFTRNEDGSRTLLPGYNTFAEARKVGISKDSSTMYWHPDSFIQLLFEGATLDTMDDVVEQSYLAYTTNSPYAYIALPGAVTNTPTNTEKSADIWTPLADMTNNVIMGLNTEDELRSLIAELHEYGIDQILQEANDNYALLMN